MLKQTIILTALPHGLIKAAGKTTKLRIGVFVTPRLRADQNERNLTLKNYPSWENWVRTIIGEKIPFRVRFGDAKDFTATPDLSPLNEKMWTALFPAEQTKVTPFVFQSATALYRLHKPVELSVGALHKELRQRFSSVLPLYKNSTLPHRGAIHGNSAIRSFGRPSTPIPVVGAKKQANGGDSKTPPEQSDALATAQDVLHSDLQQSGAAAPLPDFDFHERVSLLGDYPALLPMLGLVINLTVDLPQNLPPNQPSASPLPLSCRPPPLGFARRLATF